jgi:hypothetical protein
MDTKLTKIEKKQLEIFLSSTEKATEPSWYFISSSLLMLIGAFLFAYTVFLTLKNLTDRVVFRLFFPGAGVALFLILVGVSFLRYSQKVGERKCIAKIIKKLMK